MKNITCEQRQKLEDLWFLYGNYGKKFTTSGHKFIQNILEKSKDNRKLYNPPKEVIKAVDKILSECNCLCKKIGGTQESVMGPQRKWEITFSFGLKSEKEIFLSWDIEGAVAAWKNKYPNYNSQMIKSCILKEKNEITSMVDISLKFP